MLILDNSAIMDIRATILSESLMQIIPAQLAKNQFGDLLMKAQREPVEISKHGKRVAVVISPEDYEQFESLKLQSLKNVLAESLAQADRDELCDADDVFSPLTVEELNSFEGKTRDER